MVDGPTMEPVFGPLEIPVSNGDGAVAVAPKLVWSSGGLQVTRTDQIDFARKRGVLAYVYRFGRYEIRVGALTFAARRYADTWAEIAILTGPHDRFTHVPYDDPAFSVVAGYFFQLTDVTSVKVLVPEGYVAVERGRLAARTT
jgi:hypothetical protein